MKKLINKNELQKHFFDGMSILVGGFMAVGTPETIIDEIVNLDIRDITITGILYLTGTGILATTTTTTKDQTLK